jgi:hypothetical protein
MIVCQVPEGMRIAVVDCGLRPSPLTCLCFGYYTC